MSSLSILILMLVIIVFNRKETASRKRSLDALHNIRRQTETLIQEKENFKRIMERKCKT